jgi:hypothetical protein
MQVQAISSALFDRAVHFSPGRISGNHVCEMIFG